MKLTRTISILFPSHDTDTIRLPGRKPYQGTPTIRLAEHRPRPTVAKPVMSSGPPGMHEIPFRGEIT